MPRQGFKEKNRSENYRRTRWTSPEVLRDGAMTGAILETYVVGEILKSYCHNGLEPPLWFYRDDDQNEIDLVIEKDGALHPVEIKRSAAPSLSDCAAFRLLEKLRKNAGLGAVICLRPERAPLSRAVVSIPVCEI